MAAARPRAFPLYIAVVAALALGIPVARAEMLQPDVTYRDAQFALRAALRDTVGQSTNAARLDTLGVSLLRLNRYADARKIFTRVLELYPGDDAAEAGLGKLALWNDRLAEAESLLAGGIDADPTASADLLAARIRRGEFIAAASLADSLGQTGHAEMLRRLAEGDTWRLSGASEVSLPFQRAYPLPLVRVKINGQRVLMAVETGAGDLLIDDYFARVLKVSLLPASQPVLWNGDRVTVRNAMVQRLDLEGLHIENVPAGVLKLANWSVEVNPQGEHVVGVIGINLLRHFSPALDYDRLRLELRPAGAAIHAAADARRIPFEIWGENELTVYGTLNGGRRMAMALDSGIPGCGVAAPPEVFEEIGLKAGTLARAVTGAGSMLRGRPWTSVSVPAVIVGPISKDKVSGWSGGLDSSELWRHGVRRDAALSGDFLRGWRVTIDWSTRELVFENP